MAKSASFYNAAIVATKSVFLCSMVTAFGVLLVSCAGTAPKISESVRSALSMDAVSGLNDKLLWILSHAETGGEYAVVLDFDEDVSTAGNLIFKKKSKITNVTITLRSAGENRTISPAHFKVGLGVTLILDKNITLMGPPMDNEDGTAPSNNHPAVSVSSGGTLVMNEGSAIIGNTNNFGMHGGGVYVSSGGAFYMNGGTISGNRCIAGKSLIKTVVWTRAVDRILGSALAIALKSKPIDPKDVAYPASRGGGVYVSGQGIALFGKPDPSGVFVKTGGTITGYDSDPENGNVVMDGGWPVNGLGSADLPYTVSLDGGHAIYFFGSDIAESKIVNTTVGPYECFEFRDGIYTETRCANPKPAEIVAEAEPAPEEARAADFAEAVREIAAPLAPQISPTPQTPQTSSIPPAPQAPPEPARPALNSGLPRIAAYVFGAEDPALNMAMATRLVAALSNSGRYQPSKYYKEFFTAANEQKGGAAYISAEQLNRLGKRFGAEYVCVAEIFTAFGEYQAVAHILDVESATVVAAGAGDVPLRALTDLAAAADQIAGAMFKNRSHAALPAAGASSGIIYADRPFTDGRDGNTYGTIKIGGNVWMSENLNYQTQNGSWCYDDVEQNCDLYGRLYDWETAMTACPDGWRLPNDQDWETLAATAAGGKSASAIKLKAKNGWGDGGNGTNDYGFAAIPGGRRRHNDGVSENIGTDGHWWTATPSGANFAYTRNMSYRFNNVYINYYDHKRAGFSVRCIQE